VDTQAHYQQTDLLERELLRPQLLRDFGWQIAHVLTCDWYHESAAVLDRLVRLIEEGPDAANVETPGDESEDVWTEFDGPEEPEPPVPTSAHPESPDATATPAPGTRPDLTPSALVVGSTPRYFEFVGGGSAKFWAVSVEGNAVTVHFGRIGTKGQTQTKLFADAQAATHTARRLVAEKTGKGYQEKPSPSA
jgi:predicted DNA-binding WGR domain protein